MSKCVTKIDLILVSRLIYMEPEINRKLRKIGDMLTITGLRAAG